MLSVGHWSLPRISPPHPLPSSFLTPSLWASLTSQALLSFSTLWPPNLLLAAAASSLFQQRNRPRSYESCQRDRDAAPLTVASEGAWPAENWPERGCGTFEKRPVLEKRPLHRRKRRGRFRSCSTAWRALIARSRHLHLNSGARCRERHVWASQRVWG